MKLILHVGHSKTGSSFMQANLARNADFLQENGVFYPVMNAAEKDPAVSSGNGYLLMKKELPIAPAGTRVYLLSSELLFGKILRGGIIDDVLNQAFKALGVSGAEFFVYVRDPIDHAESAYQQEIKRGGATSSVESFFKTYNMPKSVVRFHNRVTEIGNCSTSIYNYSKHNKDALQPLLSKLGVSSLPEKSISKIRINRSLTASEHVFQKELNYELGKAGGFISDDLCNKLPQIPSDKIFPSEEIQIAMLERLSSDLEQVEKILEDGETYGRVIRKELASLDQLHFDKEQVSVLARSLGKKLTVSDRKLAQLTKENTEYRIETCVAKARYYLLEAQGTTEPEQRMKIAKKGEALAKQALALCDRDAVSEPMRVLIEKVNAQYTRFLDEATSNQSTGAV